jgi:hypothetical protein
MQLHLDCMKVSNMAACKNCCGRGGVKNLKLSWAVRKGCPIQGKALGRIGADGIDEYACPICGGSGKQKDSDSEDD